MDDYYYPYTLESSGEPPVRAMEDNPMFFVHFRDQNPFARFPRIRHVVRFLYASAMDAVAFFMLVAAACWAIRWVFLAVALVVCVAQDCRALSGGPEPNFYEELDSETQWQVQCQIGTDVVPSNAVILLWKAEEVWRVDHWAIVWQRSVVHFSPHPWPLEKGGRRIDSEMEGFLGYRAVRWLHDHVDEFDVCP